jgi:hypothetical protein
MSKKLIFLSAEKSSLKISAVDRKNMVSIRVQIISHETYPSDD